MADEGSGPQTPGVETRVVAVSGVAVGHFVGSATATARAFMSEDEWHECDDVGQLAGDMIGSWSRRKLVLFVVAYVRHLMNEFPTEVEAVRDALLIGDRLTAGDADARADLGFLLDGDYAHELSVTTLTPERRRYYAFISDALYHAGVADEPRLAFPDVAQLVAQRRRPSEHYDLASLERPLTSAEVGLQPIEWGSEYHEERRRQADLFRDLFTHPYFTPHVEPDWITANVRGVAAEIDRTAEGSELSRERRDWAALHDALLEAGCDDERIIRHARPSPDQSPPASHYRGCWLIDQILGGR